MVNAANATLPTVTVTVGAPVLGGASPTISFKLTNPASNQFAITGFTLVAPAGWTVLGCTAGLLLTSAVPSGNSCQYGSGAINPGSADTGMKIHVMAPTGTYPFTNTFTSTVQDGSSSAFYTGPTFSLQVIDPTSTITVTPAASSNFIAGSAALTETATLSPAQPGVPIVFSAPGYPGTSTFSFTPASVATDATGKAVTSFKPSNLAGDATTVNAEAGTNALVAAASTGTITTVNGPPTGVALAFTAGNSFGGTNYLSNAGTTSSNNPTAFTGAVMPKAQLTASLTDAFGNPVNFASFTGGTDIWTITLTTTAPGGKFDAFSSVVNHPSSIKCTQGGGWSDTSGNALTPAIACPSGATNTFALPYDYLQTPDYGTTGVVTSGASGTYLGTSFISTLLTSGSIFSSTLFGASVTAAAAPTSVKAGGTTQVSTTLGIAAGMTTHQNKAPFTLYLDKATSYESAPAAADYGATSLVPAVFSSGKTTESGTTNSSGMFQSTFTVDTCANQPSCPTGSHAFFYANFTYPVNSGLSATGHLTTLSADTSPAVITIAGTPSQLQFYVTYDTGGTNAVKNNGKAVLGATLFVDVFISDNFKNLAINPGPGQIQIALGPASLVLSAINIYIPANCVDTSGIFSTGTCAPFGVVTWTLPATASALTLTASGVLGGASASASFTVNIVSKIPSITVQKPTPLNGVIYSSSNGVLFTGVANASAGYPGTGVGAVTISSVTFSADGGASTAATLITSGHDVSWQGSVFFGTQGVHNITFTATDSLGNTISSQSFKVLIDSSAPTIKFTTVTGSTLTYGSAAMAVIFDTEGDLNTTSVTATFNGTAVASANLVITGTNTLGSNSSFQVAINNLPAGKWVVKLTASDLAGNSNTGVSITVTVSVPFAQSVVINSATYTTIGSFPGISVSATNIWSSSQNLVVFAVWKNGAGQTVAVATGGLTLASGATGTAFAPLTNALPSGSYTVNVFVITTSNNPVSSTTTITVTV
jgi:hypothetical protein